MPEGRMVAIAYFKAIRRQVIAPLLAAISETFDLESLKLAAAVDPGVGATDRVDIAGEVISAGLQLRNTVAPLFTIGPLDQITRTHALRMAVMNRSGFTRQMKALGVDAIGEDPDLGRTIELFAQTNARLITNMAEDHIRRVETITIEGLRSGKTAKQMGAEISKAAKIPKRRAALIARDQVASLNGTLSQNRMQAAGVEKFIWRTSQDERVRPEHAALEGHEFPTSTGAPGEGFPGQPINCRCTSEPVLSDVEIAA
ncbi:MAG: hypothetical protein GY926_19390 [bacterium]|nr:hypothetical protein [bacterium]